MNKLPLIAVTMGDPAGIGPEVTLEGLLGGPKFTDLPPVSVVVFGDIEVLEFINKKFNYNLELEEINNIDEIEDEYVPGDVIKVLSISRLDPTKIKPGKLSPTCGKASFDYVDKAVDAALEEKVSGIVTGPVNKEAWLSAGVKYPGHTEYLRDRAGVDRVVMFMHHNKLRVGLVTHHIPIKDLLKNITQEKIIDTIKITYEGLKKMGFDPPKIAVAGLNPHAGEGGTMGTEEIEIIKPAMETAKQLGFPSEGPFAPDTVFHQAFDGQYDGVVSMYHDQGLGPLKLVHFDEVVNTTLGLPFVRTSVGHGTGFDIAQKGISDCTSFRWALTTAIQMVNG